jgi:hypothetical protein
VPALELLRDARDPVLEPLGAGIAYMCQPFCEHRLGFPRERAHRAVELACEALCCVFSGRLHQLCEPLRSLVRVRRHRAVYRAFELLDLAA